MIDRMRVRALGLAGLLVGCAPSASRPATPLQRALTRAQLSPATTRTFQSSPDQILLGAPAVQRGPGTEGPAELRVLAYDVHRDSLKELLPKAGLAHQTAQGLLAVEGDALRLHGPSGTRTLLTGAAPDFAVDPSERFVAAVVRRPELSLDTDLVLVPLAGGPTRSLIAWAGSAESRPIFSPDARAVIFVSGKSGCASLYRVELSGGAVRILTNIDAARPGPATTPPPSDSVGVRWEGETLIYEARGKTVRVQAGAAR
jgi:hypothetical protein